PRIFHNCLASCAAGDDGRAGCADLSSCTYGVVWTARCRMAGYERARNCSQQTGFTPGGRRVGGRAAAYHHGSVVIDHIQPENDAMFGFRQRFEYFGQLVTAALASLDVAAAVGEIPGEYCAGEYSVHAVLNSGRQIKLAGT